MEFDFSERMPEYARMAGASVARLYRVGDYEFVIMKDNGGHYIYGFAGSPERFSQTEPNLSLPEK